MLKLTLEMSPVSHRRPARQVGSTSQPPTLARSLTTQQLAGSGLLEY